LSYKLTIPYTRFEVPARGTFSAKIMYSPRVRTSLSYKGKRQDVSFHSIIDSGADYCVFPAQFGKSIGLDITKGDHLPSYGVGGKDTLYFHKVKVTIIIGGEAWDFGCFAGFSSRLDDRGVGFLGRHGFFELFDKVTFMQKKHNVVLAGEGDKPSKFKHGGPLF